MSILKKLKSGKKLTHKEYVRAAVPILKEMGVNLKHHDVYFSNRNLKVSPGRSGELIKVDGKQSWDIAIKSGKSIPTTLKTIAHEAKHASDKRSRKEHVGKRIAEQKATAFEKRFIKKINKKYGTSFT